MKLPHTENLQSVSDMSAPRGNTFTALKGEFDIDRACKELRLCIGKEISPSFSVKNFDRDFGAQLVSDSIFARRPNCLDVSDSLRTISFNLAITDTAIRRLAMEETDPVKLLSVSSRLVETSSYSFLSPDLITARPVIHLASSKEFGLFFTPVEVATEMSRSVLNQRTSIGRVLDPGVGMGTLLGVLACEAQNAEVQITELVGLEKNKLIASWSRLVLERVRELLAASWSLQIRVCDAVVQLASEECQYDTVIMNPPYGRLKFLKSQLTNAETKSSDESRSLIEQEQFWKDHYTTLSDQYRVISEQYKLGSGPQDLQRLFLGLSIERLEPTGRLCCISPSSWLGDNDSHSLRTKLVMNRLIEKLWVYPEDSGLFNTVNQATSIVVISRDKFRKNFNYEIRRSQASDGFTSQTSVNYETLLALDPVALRVPRLDGEQLTAFVQVKGLTTLGTDRRFRNARGELDQTLGRECLSVRKTRTTLIRGENIERFVVSHTSSESKPGFINQALAKKVISGGKREDSLSIRLACRQVAYLNKKRRLSWAIIDAGQVLGNSCNYITFLGESKSREKYLKALLVTLNSAVFEWFFRVYNSNNHVANYEIDEFPSLVNDENVEVLSKTAEFLLSAYGRSACDSAHGSRIEDVSDALVAFFCGLDGSQTFQVIESVEPGRGFRVKGVLEWIQKNGLGDFLTSGIGWYHHTYPTMSAHDLEVVGYIPQGGNWTSIPESVPSKRLEQIREMTKERGGLVRTSYYGRLRPDQPAYTIATYYNRPGNGTNIPPWENRVLTSREAARLQSFPDWYIFASKETAVRKQIGNAVPPLLAYALGNQLIQHCEKTCVDLFAGAGGLSLGLELAGFDVVAASDHDQRAAQTYTFNRPCEDLPSPHSSMTYFSLGDVSDIRVRKTMVNDFKIKLGIRPLGLLVGGPPCQGFSTAGWRSEADARNDLAAIFLEFVEHLKPEIVVLENVEGLLSYQKGRVVAQLLGALHEIGYDTGSSPWVLNAECFGVPQMRRRVFIVATKGKNEISRPTELFQKCKGRRESSSDATLFVEDLPYPITVLDALYDLNPLGELVNENIGDRAFRSAYARWLSDQISTLDFVKISRVK